MGLIRRRRKHPESAPSSDALSRPDQAGFDPAESVPFVNKRGIVDADHPKGR